MDKLPPAPFKQLTPANWQQPDPTSGVFARVSPAVGVVEMDGNAWAREFLGVELKGHVPADVRALFDVARGAMIYGWFFYPLFVLGESQLHRVSEAAVRTRYRLAGGSRRSITFEKAIEKLIACGVIPDEDRERWTAVRRLRNNASHPSQHSAMPPGMVLGMLKATAHDINRLFAREATRPCP